VTVVYDGPLLTNGRGKLFATKVLTENLIANFFGDLIASTTNVGVPQEKWALNKVW